MRISHQLFLETLLMEIRRKSIPYSSYKKSKSEKRETTLRNEIIQLEENVDELSITRLESKKN